MIRRLEHFDCLGRLRELEFFDLKKRPYSTCPYLKEAYKIVGETLLAKADGTIVSNKQTERRQIYIRF